MSQSAADAITVYSDYVCPFCYLGRASLRRYQSTREAPLRIDWRPFDLRADQRRPDGTIDESVDDGKDEAYFERAKENVRQLQERYDVDMATELRTDVDSLPAQVASVHVRDTQSYETWLAFDEGIFAALWEEGRDVGDESVLVDVAEEADVDGESIRTAIGDEGLRSRVRDAFADARRQGVTGVPTFVYDGHAARGAVPPEHLERLVAGA